MAQRIQHRRGTAAQWAAANPTLAMGEWGYETDTGRVKIGDASTPWSLLPTAASGLEKEDRVHARRMTARLRRWNVGVAKADTDPVNVMVLGDSHTELGNFFGFFELLSHRTAQTPPIAFTRGWTPAASLFGAGWTGTATVVSSAPGGYGLAVTSGNAVTRVVIADRVTIYGVLAGTVTIDGGAPSAINITAGQSWDSGALESTFHTVVITPSAGGTLWGHFNGYGNEADGFRFWEIGHSGWTTANYLTSTETFQLLGAVDPDLVIVATGYNDSTFADYQEDMPALFDLIDGETTTSKVLWFPHAGQGKTASDWQNRRAFARRWCETEGVGFVDFYEVAGSVASADDLYDLSDDNAHLSTLGAQLNTDMLGSLLLDGPHPVRPVDASGTIPAEAVRLRYGGDEAVLIAGGNGIVANTGVSVLNSARNGVETLLIAPGIANEHAATVSQIREGMTLEEVAAPSAPAANTAVFYCRDNGSGKTQLVARFPTGAVQVIATEP